MNKKKASAPSSALEKAKQQHFDLLRKNNAITDAKNGELSLGAMKALDAILQVYQEKQETKMHLELSLLRKKLGLQNNNAYVERIKTYLLELKLPFELRDFNDSKSGKKVSWALTSFLQDVKSYKESQHLIEINISENFLDYLVEKALAEWRMGNYDEAIYAGQQALKSNAKGADAYKAIGLAYGEKGKKAEAIKNLTKAKELGDPQAQALINCIK